MFTTSFRDTCLSNLGGFIGLIQSITAWRAGTVTEASYTGYGTRPAVSWTTGPPYADASPTPSGRQRANTAAVTFPQNTGSNQNQIGFGVYSANSGGTLQCIGLLETDVPRYGTVDPTTETITSYAHGLGTDERIYVLAAPGAVIPTGFSEDTAYWVRSGSTTDTFTIAATQGGGAVNATAGGAALFAPYTAVTVATNATPEFAIGALLVQI